MKILILLIILLSSVNQATFSQDTDKRRLLVLTAIEADPDDAQTLIRLLLYSNGADVGPYIQSQD